MPVLFVEPFEGATVAAWEEQGLPHGMAPEDFLHSDKILTVNPDLCPIPAFDDIILKEDDTYIWQLDLMGSLVKRKKSAPNMYYGHQEYPVKDMASWEAYKKRFDWRDRIPSPERLAELARLTAESEQVVAANIWPYFMRLGFYGMGLENFLCAFYEDPALIHSMFEYWEEFTEEVCRPLFQACRIDYMSLAEDLAYKASPHFSPEIYRGFFLPLQKRLLDLAQECGIPLRFMWSAGDFHVLIPAMQESGINGVCPVERLSGADPLELRRCYGKELLIMGGVDKTAIAAGKAAIDRELDRLMPLIEQGGFIPLPDDMLPPETPLENVVYYVEKLRGL